MIFYLCIIYISYSIISNLGNLHFSCILGWIKCFVPPFGDKTVEIFQQNCFLHQCGVHYSFYAHFFPRTEENANTSLSVNLSIRFMNNTTMYNSLPYYISIAIVVLAVVAFVGNALVLAAIWSNTTLRTNCYILIAGMALTDLSSGLLAQPIYASIDLFHLNKSERPPYIMMGIAEGSLTFITSLTLLILTLLAFERWLHMNCQRTFKTARRAVIISATLTLASIPGTVFRILSTIKRQHGFTANFISLIVLSFCFIVTSLCYIGVFQTIRRHRQQIQANGSSQNFGQPAINLTEYKKSA